MGQRLCAPIAGVTYGLLQSKGYSLEQYIGRGSVAWPGSAVLEDRARGAQEVARGMRRGGGARRAGGGENGKWFRGGWRWLAAFPACDRSLPDHDHPQHRPLLRQRCPPRPQTTPPPSTITSSGRQLGNPTSLPSSPDSPTDTTRRHSRPTRQQLRRNLEVISLALALHSRAHINLHSSDPWRPPDTAPTCPPSLSTRVQVVVPSTATVFFKAQARASLSTWSL